MRACPPPAPSDARCVSRRFFRSTTALDAWAAGLRFWTGLALATLPCLSAEFGITGTAFLPDGRFAVTVPATPDSYYRLLTGSEVTRIAEPVSLELGSDAEIELAERAASFPAEARFFRVEAVPIAQPLDTDQDGMDDVFELARPSILDPLDYTDAFEDPDRDYLTNLDEYRAGSDPLVSAIIAPSLNRAPAATTATTLELSGTAPVGSYIRVEGGAALATNSVATDGTFTLAVPLTPNRLNRLFVSSVGGAGRTSIGRPIEVLQDSQPPTLFIDFPTNGMALATAQITVAGRVGDSLSGYRGLNVWVHSSPSEGDPPLATASFATNSPLAATVDVGIGPNGTYERGPVLLAEGANLLTVIATDALGNRTLRQAQVNRPVLEGARLAAVAGDRQMTNALRRLSEPLWVRAENADGSPLADVVLIFEITRSDGRLLPVATNQLAADWTALPNATTNGAMRLELRTDAAGEARAWWTLGSDAGCANNRVCVTSAATGNDVFFCASATGHPARQINIGSGNNQKAEAGALAPEPLRVWVSDGLNPAPGIPVTFRVVQGGGLLLPGGRDSPLPSEGRGAGGEGGEGTPELTGATGATGHASVSFLAGPDAGQNLIEASFPGQFGLPATFIVYGVARDLSRPGRFNGLVLDNTSCPIGQAYCELAVAHYRMGTFSDAQGRFRFDDVPGGMGHLYVNGRTATSIYTNTVPTNSFPSLAYSVITVANAENSLPTPVLLPRLNPANAVLYHGTNDLVLTCAGIEGLKFTIQANSMADEKGNRVTPANPAIVSLDQVHHDNVPMPMPDGVAPPFAWTFQPGGAHFDAERPVKVEYPNMSGLAPGSIAYFLSFNHDTERFEIVASGSVTPDGSTIVTDPGSGITISGWGCNCPPYSVTGQCNKCSVDESRRSLHADGDESPIVCTVEIRPRSMKVFDGQDSDVFTVEVSPKGLKIENYRWLVEGAWPAGAGNNPRLNYSSQNDRFTKIEDAHWYAPNNDPSIWIDGPVSDYAINCEVTVNGQRFRAKEPSRLRVGAQFSGEVIAPTIAGAEEVEIAMRFVDGKTQWYVAGIGALRRTPPLLNKLPNRENQFYEKVLAHERHHLKQWTEDDRWKNLYDASDLYRVAISRLTSFESQQDLYLQIFDAVNQRVLRDFMAEEQTRCVRELEAHEAAYTVQPRFLHYDSRAVSQLYECEFSPGLQHDDSPPGESIPTLETIEDFPYWHFSINSQVVVTDRSQTVVMPNVSAPDQFGPGGPGTIPDFVSDDYVRVLGVSTAGGTNRYAFSEFFQIRQGETTFINDFTFTDIPPRQAERLEIVVPSRTLRVGTTNQLRVIAHYADGTTNDVTRKADWTSYRLSNPALATLSPDSVLIPRAPGIVFVTAVNEAVTAVLGLDLTTAEDQFATLRGSVLDSDGMAAAGAEVRLVGLAQELVVNTDPGGVFSFADLPTGVGRVGVLVWLARPGGGGWWAAVREIELASGGIRELPPLTLTPLRIARASGVAAGVGHTVALRADGTLWTWGYNARGELGDGTLWTAIAPQPILPDERWRAVAAGGQHTVALRADGSLWTWGDNREGQLGDGTYLNANTPQPILPGERWQSVAAGRDHTVALREDGTLWTWGQNDFGQLGDGTFRTVNTPQPILPGERWQSVAAGGIHTLALRADGTLWAWGSNAQGRLGDGTFADANTPQPILPGERWLAVAAGGRHTAALRADGTLWTWGRNVEGQLGDSTFADANTPQPILPGERWQAVAAGGGHTVALRADGTLWTWGSDAEGQLGNGTFANTNTPQPILPGERWQAVAAGGIHTVALRGDGTLWAWGASADLLGRGTHSTSALTPQPIQTNVTWQAASAGGTHTLALREDGTLRTWGDNWAGQLGDGTFASANTPQLIQNSVTWQAVSAGVNHTLALREDGTLWAWGANGGGQLGDGTFASANTPQPILPGERWQTVAAGRDHTVALRADGTLWTWGSNNEGQLGNGTFASANTPQPIQTNVTWQAVSAGVNHTLALREDGTLWAWGSNFYSQLGDGTFRTVNTPQPILPGERWQSVAAGGAHTVALRADGTLWTWGSNGQGQLGNGTFASANTPQPILPGERWLAVAAGGDHTVALRANGTLWAWGGNSGGQLGNGTFASANTPQPIPPGVTWQAVAAGGGHTVGLRANGTLWAWGANSRGQIAQPVTWLPHPVLGGAVWGAPE